MTSAPASKRSALLLLGLFLLACLAFAPGIGQPTGVTTKDEYFLGLRTPMCIVEHGDWLVPCLDGHARLNKPPLLYWLTAVSYRAFGVSLLSARGVAVAFGALFVLATALIAWELTGDRRRSLLAGLVLMSIASIAIGSRMLLLDIPTAALSALAFYAILRWLRTGSHWLLPPIAVLLAAGFLIKGPIVLVLSGAGILALLFTSAGARQRLRESWPAVTLTFCGFLALALPWFVYVHAMLPGTSDHTLSTELRARDFLQFSLQPLAGLLVLGLPWSFLALLLAARSDWRARMPHLGFLLLWLIITVAPFFLIKTFGRYLYASLIPLSIIAAHLLDQPMPRLGRLAAWLGLLLAGAVAGLVVFAAGWFRGVDFAITLGGLAWALFVYVWWRADNAIAMAASSALLWAVVMGLVYPRLGLNAIPPQIVQMTRNSPVVMYDGPQPALLPAVLGRMLWQTDSRWRLPPAIEGHCGSFLVVAAAQKVNSMRSSMAAHGLSAVPVAHYRTLTSRVSWVHMGRTGLSRSEVLAALARHDLDALAPRIDVFRAGYQHCATAPGVKHGG
jgi:4-amino-4-deoxy-L-arabinose transferase-like glycosyltransferase